MALTSFSAAVETIPHHPHYRQRPPHRHLRPRVHPDIALLCLWIFINPNLLHSEPCSPPSADPLWRSQTRLPSSRRRSERPHRSKRGLRRRSQDMATRRRRPCRRRVEAGRQDCGRRQGGRDVGFGNYAGREISGCVCLRWSCQCVGCPKRKWRQLDED